LISLQRSAELGFAFAQALMAGESDTLEEIFKFAQLASSQGERDGFYRLGVCFRFGRGCEKDLDKAKENFLHASQLAHISSMCGIGLLLDSLDPQRWQRLGRAAALGAWLNFLDGFAKQVELFNRGSGSAAVMFAIGQALQGHVNEEQGRIFNERYNFEFWIRPAKQAIIFYDGQIKATKGAMHAWTQVGIRRKVVKDVRKLIAKLIWDSREEALYDVSEVRK
jgi:TPR repeat protein